MMEQELHFENKYIADEQMISEYVRRVLCRNTVIVSFLMVCVAGVLSWFTFSRSYYVYGALFAVLAVAMLVFGLRLVPSTIKKYMQSDKLNEAQKYSVVRFYDYTFSMEEGTFSMDFDYRRVYRVYDLKYSYVLMFTKGNGVMLKKDGFTIGNFDSFKPFIQQHCSRAIFPK